MRYSISCIVNFVGGKKKDYTFHGRMAAKELVEKFGEVIVMSESLDMVSSFVFSVVRHEERDEMADFDADMERDEREDG